MKKYVVRLSPEEREELKTLVSKGKVAARKRKHAEVLLKADENKGRPKWIDRKIAEAFDVSVRTVESIRPLPRIQRMPPLSMWELSMAASGAQPTGARHGAH